MSVPSVSDENLKSSAGSSNRLAAVGFVVAAGMLRWREEALLMIDGEGEGELTES
jgi:hypothetical protein